MDKATKLAVLDKMLALLDDAPAPAAAGATGALATMVPGAAPAPTYCDQCPHRDVTPDDLDPTEVVIMTDTE